MRITGTWDEIATLGDKLRDKELTLIVRDSGIDDEDDLIQPAQLLSGDEWDYLREQVREAVSKEWPEGLSVTEAIREDRR